MTVTVKKVQIFSQNQFRGDSASGPTDTVYFETHLDAVVFPQTTHGCDLGQEPTPVNAEYDSENDTYYVDDVVVTVVRRKKE